MFRGAFAVTALVAVPSMAVELSGSLGGLVVDDTGTPIAGVRVEIKSPQMIGGTKTQTTNAEGQFRFRELEPGSYTVKLSSQSYAAFEETNIIVGIGSNVDRDYLLDPIGKVGADAPVVKVTATRPMVDVTKVTQGTSFTADFSDRTVTGRSYQDLALFAPGTADTVGAPGNPTFHGGTYQSNVYLLDGLNITDPVTQTFSANFNFDSIGELQIITGGMDAEYGQATGGAVNIITRSGGDEITLDASVYYGASQLQLREPTEINKSYDLNANLSIGGPIIRKKLWFFVAGQYINNSSESPVTSGPFYEANNSYRAPSRDAQGFLGLAKLKWQATDWQKLSLLVTSDPLFIQNEDQETSRTAEAETQRTQGGAALILRSETMLSDNLFWDTKVGYSASRLFVYPMGCAAGDYDDCAKNGTPGRTNLETGTATVGSRTLVDDRRWRIMANSGLSYFLDGFLGNHEFKLGLNAEYTVNNQREDLPGGVSYQDNGIAQTGSTLTGAGDPYRITRSKSLDKTVSGQGIGVFLQDQWRISRQITIRPGLRFDSSTSTNDVGERMYWFNTLSPRIGAAWDPIGDGKTVVRGGYYYYNETGLLTVPSFVGRGRETETYEFDPITEDYTKFFQRTGGDSAVSFKKDMVAPNMHEVVFGVSREIFEDAAVSVDFNFRQTQNQFEDDETNIIWNAEGTKAIGYRNGEQRFIFDVGTPQGAGRNYVGVDLTFDKRLANDWMLFTTYTLSRTKGTNDRYVSYTFDNPTQRPFEYGYVQDDIRHKLTGTIAYDLPYGFQVGGTGRFTSGRPLEKLFQNELYGDYLDRRAPQGFDPKDVNDPTDDIEIRTPANLFLDVRAVWRLNQLTGQDIWLIADISNILNNRPPNGFETRDVANFGNPQSKGGPLNAQLALRYKF
jgi:Carboxypeptidase regulatory-like domain/TonB-dependent Receptor Plug Domain